VIKHQRLHREPDPRVRRSLAAALAISAVLVVSALLVVGLRVQQVHLAYQLDALRAERARTETLIRRLEIEEATLRSPLHLGNESERRRHAEVGLEQELLEPLERAGRDTAAHDDGDVSERDVLDFLPQRSRGEIACLSENSHT